MKKNKLERGEKATIKSLKHDEKANSADKVLYFVVIFLTLFGILMVFSASSYNGEVNYNNKFYFMYKQIFGATLGIASMIALSFVDYHILIKLRYVILGVSFALLILVFVPGVGVENYGAKRWINFPFFTLQASELAKFGFIIFTASYMSKNYEKMTSFKYILPVILVGVGMCALIILEPNMSITICMILLMFSMLFFGGVKIKHFLILALPCLAVIPLLIIAEPYRLERLLAFANPWSKPLDEGFQLIQSFYSLGSGGLFGVGLFNSRQKLLFLPFSESDFILSVIGEEFGFFGVVILIGLYVLLIYRAIKIAQNSADRFGFFLAAGIACIISIQTLVNVAVVTGSIPPTGLPLPFISAGSTSLIVFLSSVGLLQSVRRGSHKSVKVFAR